jgi:hypothetical protein
VKISRIAIIFILILAAAGLGRWIVLARGSSELARRVFGGSAAFGAFRSTSVITAQRLRCNQPDGSPALADYAREPPVRLSDEQVRELKRIFTNRTLYPPDLWTSPIGERILTTCGPPNYAVLFTTQSRPVVQIALCFRCDQFGVFVGERQDAPNVNDSDPLYFMQPFLASLVKSIYPSDAQIQAIKRKDYFDHLTNR